MVRYHRLERNFNLFIMNIEYPTPRQKYKVLVRCFTFNQSKYIGDALNGFAMQQTNFPFVCLVMDDASTDGEQEVIKVWMERECDMSRAETIDIPTSVVIIVPHKTNASCTFAFYLLKQNLYGTGDKKMNHVYPWREKCEYEALCEGDDFWTDETKLQTQVSFLDANPEYGMCYTQCNFYIQNRNYFNKNAWGGSFEAFNQFMRGNTVPTLTVLCRIELVNKYLKEIIPESRGWLMGDYPMWIWFSHESRIKFIPLVTGVYRVLTSSASHSSDISRQIGFSQSSIEIRRFFEDYFKVPTGTYVEANALEKRKMYLFAINHKYLDFAKTLIRNPKLLLSMKTLSYFRYFLVNKKTSEEV